MHCKNGNITFSLFCIIADLHTFISFISVRFHFHNSVLRCRSEMLSLYSCCSWYFSRVLSPRVLKAWSEEAIERFGKLQTCFYILLCVGGGGALFRSTSWFCLSVSNLRTHPTASVRLVWRQNFFFFFSIGHVMASFTNFMYTTHIPIKTRS